MDYARASFIYRNIDIVYALFIGMLFSSAFLYFAEGLTAPDIFRVASIPQRVLLPSILVLCILVLMRFSTSFFDVIVRNYGFIGFVIDASKYLQLLSLIAFILGPMLRNFQKSNGLI